MGSASFARTLGGAGSLGSQLPTRMGETLVYDQFDVTLEDVDLLGEVELTTNLIIAASESDEHLSVETIDQILGVNPPRARHER